MSLHALELNDHAILLGEGDALRAASPGFALARDKSLVFGESARAQSRLHPNESHSRFWQDLSLEPLAAGRLPDPKVRHLADLAYSQLLAIADEAQLAPDEKHDVIVNVPGSFSRQQLGILLGIAKQTPFNIVGLVDSALAAAAAFYAERPTATLSPLIVVQQQLHQTLLSLVIPEASRLRVESVVALPSTGSQNVIDSLMQLSTDLFIDQCRFNPQHDAPTEQLLYNALPSWLDAEAQGGSLMLELAADGAVYSAKLPYESLVSALAPTRQRVLEQVVALVNRAPDARLLVCSSLNALPGLQSTLASVAEYEAVAAQSGVAASLAHRTQLVADGAIGLNRQLDIGAVRKQSPARSVNRQVADGQVAERQASQPTLAFAQLEASAAALGSRSRVNGRRVDSLPAAEREQLTLREGDELSVELDDGSRAVFSLTGLRHGED